MKEKMSVLCKTEEIVVDTHDYNSDEGEDIPLTLDDSGGENYHLNTPSSRQQQQHLQSPPQHHGVGSTNGGKASLKNIMENEKRMRREIANSNERRRMQSINAGFQSLRSLLPHHEGEKLSKAAILQQTAHYIIELEREKTHLLSQNSQLRRLLGQTDGVGSGGGTGGTGGGGGGTIENITLTTAGTIKKRKLTDAVMNIQTISDSSDEGLGSMSPEPVTFVGIGQKSNTNGYTNSSSNSNSKEVSELKARLDAERRRRLALEERLRQSNRLVSHPTQYVKSEVIEHTDNIREEDLSVSLIQDPLKLQVVEIDALPSVGQTQVVVCSSIEDIPEDEPETITEEIIRTELSDDVILREEPAEYVEVPSRLQPILEAAIKAEPKVEVERINATLTKIKQEPSKNEDKQTNSRMYLTSTSRQNLETIVEAIRHLEGDHLFGDMVEQKKAQRAQQQQSQPHQTTTIQRQKSTNAQDAPLALTNKTQQQLQQQRKQIPAELSPFIQLKKTPNNTVTVVGTAATAPATSLQAVSSNINNNDTTNNSSNNVVNSSDNFIISTINNNNSVTSTTVTGIATLKAHPTNNLITNVTSIPSTATVTIGAAALKQCRPGVIVAKQIS